MGRIIRGTVTALSTLILFFALNPNISFARQNDSPKPKAWLGVSISDVSEKASKENKLDDSKGAFVNEVSDDSPADSGGIRKGDVILQFGNKTIDDADDLVRTVEKSKVGDKVDVVLTRKGEKKNIRLVLAKSPRSHRAAFSVGNLGSRLRFMINRESQGMHLMELNDQLGEYFGAPNGSGVLVEKVQKGTAADKAGLKAGDVVLKIGKRTIDDLEDVSKAFSKFDEGDKVDIEVLRKGSRMTLPLEVAEIHEGSMFEMERNEGPDGAMHMMPWFQGHTFEFPNWNEGDEALDIHVERPNLEILRHKIDELSKGLREHRKELDGLRKQVWIRTI